MSRSIRAALAVAGSIAALAGGVTTAHADQATPRAAAASTSVQLQLALTGKCLTINKGSFANGANAVQQTCADDLDNQVFELVPTGEGAFEVRARHSGKCLEVENSGKQAGANVQQWWCTGNPQMQWELNMVDMAKELYELRPTHVADRCLDIDHAKTDNGANAQSWYCNGTDAQLWRLLPVKA
ncbi:RICIN domain-containing protein [Streptomyces albofaciens]|uniref:RICIN domain-containing protein n=1 Tax=Streptomyces albofaciens TaxID=66866 RepID=UPI00142EEA64|nr:RICIN domain-containing protein [Streptomyces albofaciens]